jgi:hypothetical protein
MTMDEQLLKDRLTLLDFLERMMRRAIRTNDYALMKICNETLEKLERKTVILSKSSS